MPDEYYQLILTSSPIETIMVQQKSIIFFCWVSYNIQKNKLFPKKENMKEVKVKHFVF